MKILGIETSCDETSAAIIQDGTHILSNVVVSQIDIHQAYGGVVPEIAARSHIETILPVIDQSLEKAKLQIPDIDAIAVTHTPGLLGSLLVGTLTARTLAILHNKPLYPTHHLKSHIYANWLNAKPDKKYHQTHNNSSSTPIYHQTNNQPPQFPLIALVVSGGHTQLIHMTAHNHFDIIGITRDDAIGEAFDKIAKILGLPYPGGPAISTAAKNGDPQKYPFPHPKIPDYDFSFSGLKTAVLRAIQKELNLPISTPSHQLAAKLKPQQAADFAASFQNTAIDILVEKLQAAVEKYQPASIVIAGGVAANTLLRQKITQQFTKSPQKVFFPAPNLSTDNAAMVASAAYFDIKSGVKPADPYKLDISPRSQIA